MESGATNAKRLTPLKKQLVSYVLEEVFTIINNAILLRRIDEEQADAEIQEGLAKVDHLLALIVDRQVSHGKIRALQRFNIKNLILSFVNFDMISCMRHI